ncbi:Centrin-3 [Tritrichomonas musculus]|uniref:Centrin-3 n=1 Tax=Tritrichomonas musculus TaxID=1915356 RepID=A0ABR2L944_9EUKA
MTSLTQDQQLEIREAFDIFDSDKSGSIDRHELRVALRAMGFDATKDEVTRIMKQYDPDATGLVNFPAFQKIVEEKLAQRRPEDEIQKAYNLFADGQDGISINSLRRITRELGETLNDEELKAMIDEFDQDHDGKINYEEFLTIVNGR